MIGDRFIMCLSLHTNHFAVHLFSADFMLILCLLFFFLFALFVNSYLLWSPGKELVWMFLSFDMIKSYVV